MPCLLPLGLFICHATALQDIVAGSSLQAAGHPAESAISTAYTLSLGLKQLTSSIPGGRSCSDPVPAPCACRVGAGQQCRAAWDAAARPHAS